MQLSPFRGLALRNTSFGWSRCCTNPIGSRTSSVSTCATSVSDVTSTSDVSSVSTVECATTVDTNFYEGEQSFSSCSVINCCEGEQSSCSMDSSVSASVECVVSEHTDFYGGEQCCSPVVTDDIVDAVFKTPMLLLAWMSFPGSIEYLAPKPKHKGLPKVKIKGY